MLVIGERSETAKVPDQDLRSLIEARIKDIEPFIESRLDELVRFIVVDPGEPLDCVDAQLGFSVLSNCWTGTRFGESGFSPCFELIEEHAAWFEIVFIFSDGGEGAEVFVPKHPDVDPVLLAMCKRYAVPTPQGDPAA